MKTTGFDAFLRSLDDPSLIGHKEPNLKDIVTDYAVYATPNHLAVVPYTLIGEEGAGVEIDGTLTLKVSPAIVPTQGRYGEWDEVNGHKVSVYLDRTSTGIADDSTFLYSDSTTDLKFSIKQVVHEMLPVLSRIRKHLRSQL